MNGSNKIMLTLAAVLGCLCVVSATTFYPDDGAGTPFPNPSDANKGGRKNKKSKSKGGGGNGNASDGQSSGSNAKCENDSVWDSKENKCDCHGKLHKWQRAGTPVWEGKQCDTIKQEYCDRYGDCCKNRKKMCVKNAKPRPHKVFVSVSTYDRFWQAALTTLSLVNGNMTDCDIFVFDDASPHYRGETKELFEDAQKRGLIKEFQRLEKNGGFIKMREFLVDTFLNHTEYTHWLHLDDDIILAPNVIQDAIHDYTTYMNNKGLLFVYVNDWARRVAPQRGDLWNVPYAGGASFILSRETTMDIGNIYAKLNDSGAPEKSNREFWTALHNKGYMTMGRRGDLYKAQHTGNADSAIFGKKKNWEGAWLKSKKDPGGLLPVDGFDILKIRQSLKDNAFPSSVVEINKEKNEKLKLPNAPTHSRRQDPNRVGHSGGAESSGEAGSQPETEGANSSAESADESQVSNSEAGGESSGPSATRHSRNFRAPVTGVNAGGWENAK